MPSMRLHGICPAMTIDCVVVLRPTRHKVGHFGDVSPSQSLGMVWKKLDLNLTQQMHAFASQKKLRLLGYQLLMGLAIWQTATIL